MSDYAQCSSCMQIYCSDIQVLGTKCKYCEKWFDNLCEYCIREDGGFISKDYKVICKECDEKREG